MAQHLPIQAKHHCQLKQLTQLVTWGTAAWRTSQHRLAKQAQTAWQYLPTARRQHSSSATVSPMPPGRALPYRQAPRGAEVFPSDSYRLAVSIRPPGAIPVTSYY